LCRPGTHNNYLRERVGLLNTNRLDSKFIMPPSLKRDSISVIQAKIKTQTQSNLVPLQQCENRCPSGFFFVCFFDFILFYFILF